MLFLLHCPRTVTFKTERRFLQMERLIQFPFRYLRRLQLNNDGLFYDCSTRVKSLNIVQDWIPDITLKIRHFKNHEIKPL